MIATASSSSLSNHPYYNDEVGIMRMSRINTQRSACGGGGGGWIWVKVWDLLLISTDHWSATLFRALDLSTISISYFYSRQFLFVAPEL